MKKKPEQPELMELLEDVCQALDANIDDVKSKWRKRECASVRFIFCYVAYFYTVHPLKKIGATIGGRDHTTVINARDTARDFMNNSDADFLPIWKQYQQRSALFNELTVVRVTRVYINPEYLFKHTK